ncbi:MAG: biotin--[acetyl-CoA-carboxylase] ligase [Chthoniobacterales bacterium]
MTPLDAAAIRDGAGAQLIGHEIIVVDETASTNDLLFEKTGLASAEGLVIFAESQTAGRGQRGNRWISSPRLGLWFSILLRPRLGLGESQRLTSWLAERIAATARAQFALDAVVKPPNDVYVGPSKIAGVLVELRAVTGAPHVAIAGVGINANQAAADFPEELRGRAASLRMLIGHEIDRNVLASALLRDLDQTYREAFG